MAFQLIYTSAPRLLEAGRSGFGTVARHRSISPLLASSIERTSQFSRLQGTDPTRVIYCHRIITIAGARFHVLSAVRDAGADYTGRTNHIAHHLIIEPREIVQLGAECPSPAEVLSAMHWATSWNQTPRYLDASEEIALSTLHPRMSGMAWAQVTGNASQAWLLATGEASRGTYLIKPVRCDLLEIFAESLQLIPQRLWQIPFTTSLQSSDEITDFRWIGLEEHSPLRTQTETSGRPTLNLADPSNLPLASTPQHGESQASISLQSETLTTLFKVPDAMILHSSEEDHCRIALNAADAPDRKPAQRSSILIKTTMAAAFIAVLGCGSYFCYKNLNESIFRRDSYKEIDNLLNPFEYFEKLGADLKASADTKGPDAVNPAKEIAAAVASSLQSACDAKFDQMLQPLDEARKLAHNADINIPTEFNLLYDRLQNIKRLNDPKPQSIKSIDEIKKLQNDAQQTHSGGGPNSFTFKKINTVINELAERRLAETLFSLLSGKTKPPLDYEFFEKELSELKSKQDALPDAQKTKSLLISAQIINAWKIIQTQGPDSINNILVEAKKDSPASALPLWLKQMANLKIDAAAERNKTVMKASAAEEPKLELPTSQKPPPMPVPLYFVSGVEKLDGLVIEELVSGQSYQRGGVDGEFKELLDINGGLRTAFQGEAEFQINGKKITHLKASKNFTLPFSIRAKNEAGTIVFQVWVAPPDNNNKALFGPLQIENITRNGDFINLNPSLLEQFGRSKKELYIQLPPTCFYVPSTLKQQLNNWCIDISGARKSIEGAQQIYKIDKEKYEKNTEDLTNKKVLRTNYDKSAMELKSVKETLTADDLKFFKIQIGCENFYNEIFTIDAIDKLYDFKKVNQKKIKTLRPYFDGLTGVKYKIDKLNESQQNKDKTEKLNQKTKDQIEKLNKIMGVIALLMASDFPVSAFTEDFDAAIKNSTTEQVKTEDKLKECASHAILKSSVPPGTYLIYARDGEAYIPLVKIDVPL